jgi:hypothetical protein
MGKKSVFYPYETHILAKLDIMVLYIIWGRGVEKYKVSAENSNGLAFGFTNKHLFIVKMHRKYIFHPSESYILAQLHITVSYTIFLSFWKISSFSSKPKALSHRFYWKMSVHSKNKQTISIWSPLGPYSCTVRHNGIVHNFLEVLKNIEFLLKMQSGSTSILQTNICSRRKWAKIRISTPLWHILGWLDLMVLYTIFWRFWKISSFG